MNELLNRYKALTMQQKVYLTQGNFDEAIRLMNEKEKVIFSLKQMIEESESKDLSMSDPTLQAQVQEILRLNREVVGQMQEFRQLAGDELTKIQHGRQTQGAYASSGTPDAYFFDKKN